MTDILLPAVSPTMEKATLSRWIVQPGAEIKRGDIIAEIETDKASVEIAAESAGVLSEIVIAAGTADVLVGTVIGRLGGVVVPLRPGAGAREVPDTSAADSDASTPVRGDSPALLATPVADGLAQPSDTTTHTLASPLARRLSRQLGIDLRTVQGSGQRGRITKADLERVDARLQAPAMVQHTANLSNETVYPAPYGVPHEIVALSAMRKTIARRLSESKRQVPHFYMTVDVEMDALLKLREQCNLRASTQQPHPTKLSLNDFMIRAVALALEAVPAANVQYAAGSMLRFQRVDISVAVAVPEGLYTPVIRDAANKGVQTIADEMRGLIDKAKASKLHPSDYEGGTFSISNLGMYGIKQFEAVINPPQAAILAIGSTERRVVPGEADQVRVAHMLSATLSCDHRVIDGSVGAALLSEIKQRLQDPLGLLLR
jgi:pyruvate dehydrogenase E2 component (dihydrolipoamide acetyltransferase)